MGPPINYDLLFGASDSTAKDEEPSASPPVTQGIDYGRLFDNHPGPAQSAQKFIDDARVDEVKDALHLRPFAADAAAQPYDTPGSERYRGPETVPTRDFSGTSIISGEKTYGESRVEFLRRKEEEYQHSPQKIVDDLRNDARIEAAPTGMAALQQKLGSMRLFTNRSLIEFNNNNNSGFHVGTPFAHPLDTAKELALGIPRFFVDLVRQPAALLLDEVQGNQYLLPEEREQYARETIANYAGLLVGGAAGTVSKELRIGRDILRVGTEAAERAGATVPTGELELLSQTLPKAIGVESTVPGKIITGATEGAAGGATTGLLAGRTPEESRNLAATYALMALPAGLAYEGIMSRVRKPGLGKYGEAAANAGQLSAIRQMQSTMQQNVVNAANTFLKLDNPNSLAMAAELSQPGTPMVVQGVSKFRPNESSVIHYRPDGLMDISFGGAPDIASTFPERIETPAFRDPETGRVFEGTHHGEAGDKAQAAGVKDEAFADEGNDGFVTNRGRFVNRREAADIARASGQIIHADARELITENLKKVAPEEEHYPTPEQMSNVFRVGGYFPNEIVSFLGNDYHYVDPVIDAQGALTGHKIADAHGHIFEVNWDQLRHGPDMAINSFLFDKPDAQKALFRHFTNWMDKFRPGDIERKPFTDIVAAYVSNNNLNPRIIEPLHRFLSDRYGEQLRSESLTSSEKSTYARIINEMNDYRQRTAGDLVDAATSNGMYIERQNGAMIIRDSKTGAFLELAHSPEEAQKFIQNVVNERGPDMTPGGIPDGINRGLIPVPPPPGGPHTSAWNPMENGWFGELRDLFSTSRLGTKFTGMRQIMISLDNQLGTHFFENVYQPLYDTHLRKYANMHEDMTRAAATARMAKGLTPEQLDQITTARETFAPDDMIKSGGLFNRPFTPRELAGAKWFIENQVDIKKSWQYYRALKNLERKSSYYTLPEAEKTDAVHKLQASLNADEATIEGARIMGEVLRINKPGDISIYGITRLAEAVMDGHLSQDKYVEKNFPAADTEAGRKMRLVLNELNSHFTDLADRFNVPDEQRLGGYFSHLRNFKNDEIIASRDAPPVFTSELLRTGEMSEYDRDPINVLVRYINSGYANKFTRSALENAYKYLNDATGRLTDPAQGQYIRQLLTDNYINEIRGIPHASTGFSEKLVNKFLDKIGVKSEVSVRRDFVNTMLSLSSSATIGFRPMQGLRDAVNFTSIYYSRFGAERFGDLLTIMARVSPQELEQAGIIAKSNIGEGAGAALAREGVTPTLGPVSVLTAQERLQNSISARTAPYREVIQKVGEEGIKWGVQHTVYQWGHAASYLESSTRALKELNNLSQGKYGSGDGAKAKAYENLFINSYDPPVAAHFDKLVTDGKFSEAADFLGRATSFETVSVFGLANHPAGWGTNTGRMFGQFGNWPVWARTSLARLLSRGTRGERTRVAARFGATQGGLVLASLALGLNLNSWYLPGAAPLFSAGQHLAAAQDSYDEDEIREYQQAAAAIVLGVPGSAIFRGGPAVSLALNAAQAATGSPQAIREGGQALVQAPLLGVPGSYLLRDIYEGVNMAENGNSPVSAWLRAFGVRSTEDDSLLNPGGAALE